MASPIKRITILEEDLTTAGAPAASTDIAYVPGFTTTKYDEATNKYTTSAGDEFDGTALDLNEPVLCTTVDEFEYAFGKNPFIFEADEEYPAEFAANDKPDDKIVKKGEVDKSYVYAKSLIKMGIPVIYKAEFTVTTAATTKIVVEHKLAPVVAAKAATADTFGNNEFYRCTNCGKYFSDDKAENEITDLSTLYILKIGMEDNEENRAAAINYLNELVAVTGTEEADNKTVEVPGETVVPTVANFYSHFEGNIDKLEDKGEFTVKYITSGGYPVLGYNENSITRRMLSLCASRGDSVAIIDHTNYSERKLMATDPTSVFYEVANAKFENAQFGAMFTPWANYSGLPISWKEVNIGDVGYKDAPSVNSIQLPASFAYLAALAVSIRSNANWEAIAGVKRGQVPYITSLNTKERLSNTIADSYQSRDDKTSINAITNIRPYGLTIWGNRTLFDNNKAQNLRASSFLNLRNLCSDIKKVVYTACKDLLFEQNSEILWINFKSRITPLLDRMKTGYGISGYKIIKAATHYNGEPLAKAQLAAVIKIYPLYAIEEFEITVELADDEVSVS